jgi:hypothetical protein
MSNKKALIEKRNSLRQSLECKIETGKKKRNTGSAEAFLNRLCLHPRPHSVPCLSFKFYSFRVVYKDSSPLSISIPAFFAHEKHSVRHNLLTRAIIQKTTNKPTFIHAAKHFFLRRTSCTIAPEQTIFVQILPEKPCFECIPAKNKPIRQIDCTKDYILHKECIQRVA